VAQQSGNAANESIPLFVAWRDGEILGAKAAVMTAATGNDRVVTVDVQKSTGNAAFASVLTGVGTFTNTSTNFAVTDLTLSGTPTLAENDLLRAVVTANGSNGAQAIGVIVDVILYEVGT
jgi:hypothetical protein